MTSQSRNGDNLAKRLTDFVISQLREDLGLWFEINEGRFNHKYINEADLTDGQSFLMLWFTADPTLFRNAIPLKNNGSEVVFFAWETRHDSRREFDSALVTSIAEKAAFEFDPDSSLDRCRLLSFEFRTTSWIGDIENWFSVHAPTAEFELLPPYCGKLIDTPGFQILPDSSLSWGQVSFRQSIPKNDVVSMLELCLMGIHAFETSTNALYRARSEWNELLIERVYMLARQY